MTRPVFNEQNFGVFGRFSSELLAKPSKLIAQNLTKSWSQIPHVAHHDEVDTTVLQGLLDENKPVSLLAFVLASITNTVKEFSRLNASLDSSSDTLINKHYYNIGMAVDTPQDLMVTVMKAVETLSPEKQSPAIANIAEHMRKAELGFAYVGGGSFNVTCLGTLNDEQFLLEQQPPAP